MDNVEQRPDRSHEEKQLYRTILATRPAPRFHHDPAYSSYTYIERSPQFPISTPRGFAHFIDLTRYVEAIIKPQLHIADAVVTTLFAYSTRLLTSFLDPQCHAFSYFNGSRSGIRPTFQIQRRGDMVEVFNPDHCDGIR